MTTGMNRFDWKSGPLSGEVADYITGAASRFDGLRERLQQSGIDADAQFAMFLLKPAAPLSIYHDEKYLAACRGREELFRTSCLRLEEELSGQVMIPLQIGELLVIVTLCPDSSRSAHVHAVLNAVVSREGEAGGRLLRVCASRVYYGLIHLRKAFTDTLGSAEKQFFDFSPQSDDKEDEQETRAAFRIPRWETIVKNPLDIVLSRELPDLLRDVARRSEGNEFTAKCIMVELCYSLEQYASRLRAAPAPSFSNLAEDVFHFTGLDEAYAYMKRMLSAIKTFADAQGRDFSPVVKSIVSYIHAHYEENIGLSQLADQFNMNASYLSRLLSQETGTTFVDMLAQTRIYHAKALLREGKLRVKEIGEAVGYRDYSHFYMVFKRIEGLSPKEYMRHNSS
jgi:AraC-like DNA-binding protein